MTDLRTAAQQALEALEQDNPAGRAATITTLRAALAQQAEPAVWLRVIDEALTVHHIGVADPADDYVTAKRKMDSLLCAVQDIGAYFATDAAVAKSVQEPVAKVELMTTGGNADQLRQAVRALAALNAWFHFGECRAWGTGPILSPQEADELARRVLRDQRSS